MPKSTVIGDDQGHRPFDQLMSVHNALEALYKISCIIKCRSCPLSTHQVVPRLHAKSTVIVVGQGHGPFDQLMSIYNALEGALQNVLHNRL